METAIDAMHGGGTLQVRFTSFKDECRNASESEDLERLGEMQDERIHVGGSISVPAGVKLALALYSPDDQVTVESVW